MSLKGKVHARLKKGADFELHVRTVRAEGVEVVEIRDFVPSEKWYGRGVQVEPHQLPQLIEALQQLGQYLGGSADPGADRSAGAGQGKLF